MSHFFSQVEVEWSLSGYGQGKGSGVDVRRRRRSKGVSFSTTVAWKRAKPRRIVASHAQILYSLLYSIPALPHAISFTWTNGSQWGSHKGMIGSPTNKPGATGEIGLVCRILSRGWVGQPRNGIRERSRWRRDKKQIAFLPDPTGREK